MVSFTAQIVKEGGNYVVSVPAAQWHKFTQSGNIPVGGTVNNFPIKGTLVPRKNNRLVLFIDYETRKKIGKGEFDAVTVKIEFDPEDRNLPIPEDVEVLFSENPEVFDFFVKMSSAHRREIIKFIDSAKRQETRLKYIERIREHVIEKLNKKKK